MVRLERVKRNCFLDYNNVEKYLEQSKMQEPLTEPVRTVSLTNKYFRVDDVQ